MTANQALRARFEAKPEDAVAFAALEEALFVAGEWQELLAVYARRLGASDLAEHRAPKQRARVLLRRAQVQDERLGDADGAVASLREAVALDGTLRPALAQLRRLLARRADWDGVLACADAETKLPMRPSERAQLATELGALWLEKRGDAAQARACYERALEAEPAYAPALLGIAAIAEAAGAPADAIQALERAGRALRGAERAAVLARLGKLQREKVGDAAAAAESYRRALSEDPQQSEALEALAERAQASQQWAQFDELQDRRFGLAKDKLVRLAIAHDAGRVMLERAGNAASARTWFRRALDLFPRDPVVHLYLADVARLSGDREELAHHLRKATELADNAAPVGALQESARVEQERGDTQLAASQLRRALERDPKRPELAVQLAELLAREGREEEVVELIETQLATRPGGEREVQLWLQLGVLHEERRNDPATAFDAYAQALDAEPASEAALASFERLARKLERWQPLAERLAAAAAAGAGAARAAALVRLGQLHLDHGPDHAAARAAFEAALALDAENALAHQGLDRVALATGDGAAIVQRFEREAEVTADRERLAFLVGELARLHEERGDLARARHWLERLSGARPEDAGTLAEIARLCLQLGDRAGEANALERRDARVGGAERLALRKRLAALRAELGEAAGALRAHRAVLACDANDLASARAVVELLGGDAPAEERAAALRHLVAIASGEERTAHQYRLGRLLMDEAGDLQGAGACFEEVVDAPGAPADAEERFARVLAKLGHWDALCARLDLRRRLLDPLDPRGLELDLDRAEILIDRLGRARDAAALCETVREASPRHARARDVLERALRAGGDDAQLVVLLAERAQLEADRERRALLDMERALLFEQRLRSVPEARSVLAEVAAGGSAIAEDAERKLRRLLEQEGDWAALAERLERSLGGDRARDLAALRELAALHRDRLRAPEAAIGALERALAIDARDVGALHELQALLEAAGREQDLRAAFERELAIGGDAERERLLHARSAAIAERAGDLAGAEAHHRAVVALDPGAAPSVQFLADRYERDGRSAELAELLRAQLARGAGDAGAVVSLRLRLAQLEAGALGDLPAAIATLAPAASSDDFLPIVAPPLADLLARAQRSEELIALAQRAVARAANAGERGAWTMRLGDALRASGDLEAAAEAYRRALSDRPGDPDLQASLRDLYRTLRRAEPLARLLGAELARTGGPREVPLRLELGALLAGELRDPAAALVHYRRVLELEPDHGEALDRAISAAEQAAAHDASAELLAEAARRAVDPSRRARLLARRGALLAGPLERSAEAVECYEASLALVPDSADTLAALRGVLEDRAEWAHALACFERELAATPARDGGARLAIIEEAVRFASEMLGGDAPLPWLERLSAARPGEAEPLQRIAQIHRAAGRCDALLRALEAELALSPAPERQVELALECASLLRSQARAPARAAEVLEAARSVWPGHAQLLDALDGLYAELGFTRDRLGVALARIEIASPPARIVLRRLASSLARALGERALSAAQLWAALGECGPIAHERAQLLRALAEDLTGRPDLWVRVAEAELATLEPAAAVFAERRRVLRAELAEQYANRLEAPEAAIAHWSALLDAELPRGDAALVAAREKASRELVAAMRRTHDAVSLARRLGDHLTEFPSADAAPWLELGRLRLELLHQAASAAPAFRAALDREPGSLAALRGWRTCCELLGRWRDVAASLESELALRADAGAPERAALLRRLGEIARLRLDETTRASRAYASALECDPRDLVSLRALQQLFEAMEDWRGALDLYESEVEVLDAADPERRRECWLRAAEIARVHAGDDARALRCFDAAARIAPLETARLPQLAGVLERLGDRARFAATLAAWLDAPESPGSASDELRLAEALESLERFDAALARAERAAEREPGLCDAWDRAADLRERLGRRREAADALDRAASLRGGAEAARRRVHAADLLESSDEARRCELLAAATRDDALCAEAFAKLALAASGAGDAAQAESAAERAVALAAQGSPLAPALRRDAALCGARGALALDHLTAAARLLADALALAPDHAEALAQYGRTLLRLGDVAGARRALARALERTSAPRDRAPMLALLGNAEAAARSPETALQHYREALALDAQLADAHAGMIQLLTSERREAEAAQALVAWAALAKTPGERAQRLLQAAELELSRGDRDAAGEALLREAVAADAASASAWALLAELHAKHGRWSDVIDAASSGAGTTRDAALQSRLEALRGRALEQRGELRAAADAFATASERSPRASEAALTAARLLRGLGEWRRAADVLRSFADRAPSDAVSARAAALHQLGRLLAGPLEDVDGAVEVYRRAAALDARNRECREALADLLLHRPRHWDEAVARHRELLAEDPTRLASLRGLLRVARGRGNAAVASAGLVVLRALGAATAEEAREAPSRLPFAIAAKPALLDGRFELARRLAQEASSELGEALAGTPAQPAAAVAGDPGARFRAAVTAAEGELSAPSLVPLAPAELASALTLLAELAAEVEAVSSADGGLVNALARAIGWRAKKRIKRVLDGHTADEVATLDVVAWRRSLRALASAVVVDRGESSLRDAFVAFIQADEPEGARTLPPEADLRARIAAHPEARELLALVVRAWLAGM